MYAFKRTCNIPYIPNDYFKLNIMIIEKLHPR